MDILNEVIKSCISTGIGMLFGYCFARTDWRRDSVAHGKAEFSVDKEGKVTWRWLP